MPTPTTTASSQRRSLVESNVRRATVRLRKRLQPAKGSYDVIGPDFFVALSETNSSLTAMSSALEISIEKVIQSRQITRDDRTCKVKDIMQAWIRASYPFVRNVIDTAKMVAQVAFS